MNSASALRIAIIGCGCHGTRCSTLLGDARLVVVCDKDPRRAAMLASTAHACYATNEISEALSFRPDAVIVATPQPLLSRVTSESLRAGAHVFVSRNAPFTPSELEPMLELAQHQRRTIAVEIDDSEFALPGFLQGLKKTLGLALV